ncbi:MAG: transglutaminase family protein [Candidatus Brocadiia bacterium]
MVIRKQAKIIIFILAGLLSVSSCQQAVYKVNESKQLEKVDMGAVVDEIINTPENQINILKYSLLLSKAVEPGLNIELQKQRFDNMAETISPKLKGITDPKEIINVLNNYIFKDLKFRMPKVKSLEELEFKHKFYPIVLDTKEGDCGGVGMIYLCLAERLNLPIYGVRLPRHFFLRYDDGKTRINIETTSNGKNMTDQEYITLLEPVLNKANKDGAEFGFMRNMTKKQVLASFLFSGIAIKDYNPDKELVTWEIMCVDYAIKIDSDEWSYYSFKGSVLIPLDPALKDQYRKALKELLKAYDLYHYDLSVIVKIAIGYFRLGDFVNSKNKCDELLSLYNWKDVEKRYDTEMVTMLIKMRDECQKKMEDMPVPK